MATSCIQFTVNGQKCSVDASVARDTTLNAYLRRTLGLPGTKYMCQEGACGACIVMVRARRAGSRQLELFPVNSCLVLVFSCHGWNVTTVEKVGNRRDGYSEVQQRVAAMNATQCGYCTPAWVMTLTSLLDKNLTMAELERSFGANTCRCTGYRPLLDVIKSFAVDASPALRRQVRDIEDTGCCQPTKQSCEGSCADAIKVPEETDWDLLEDEADPNTIHIDFGNNKHFYKVFNTEAIFQIMNEHRNTPYMLADGNTSKGVYPIDDYPPVVIDISEVKSLKTHYFDQNLVLGSNTSIEDCIQIFKSIAEERTEFGYLSGFVKHLLLVAHIPVREIGSLIGNLMIKHKKPIYPSDIFLLLESVGTTITLRSIDNETRTLSLPDWLQFDMTGWLATTLELPPTSGEHLFRSYKIMPRSQNSLCIVNAAFHVRLADNVVEAASFVFSFITEKFIHARQTESYVRRKNIFDNGVLQEAIKILHAELQPEVIPGEPSPAARRKLAVGLFYKFVLSVAPVSIVKAEYRSGGTMLERAVSEGKQDFQSNKELYPLNQPLPKLEAIIQSSGEAQYVNDMPPIRNEVFAAFVLSTIHSGEIDAIDATEVLREEGVIAVYTAKDIPGKNSFTKVGTLFITEDEEIIVESKVKYYGQPIAILVASTEHLAKEMAKRVSVTYKNVSSKPPVLTIDVAKKDSARIIPSEYGINASRRGTDVTKVIKGVYTVEGQYHYYMEPLTVVAVPTDNRLEIYPSSQFPEAEQLTVSEALGIPNNQVVVKIRRLGGGFGGKITRCARVSTAAALVAKKLNLACRMIMPLDSSMQVNGMRSPVQCEYEVGVNDEGEIQYLEAVAVADAGCSENEDLLAMLVEGFPNGYDSSIMNLKCFRVYTDKPSNINARGPGTAQAIATIEHIMEHIAFELKKDPTEIRLKNMRKTNNDLPALIEDLKSKADFASRHADIEAYNASNRWMKKAIQINVMEFPLTYYFNYTTLVSIYRGDGTVTVTSGGVDMGQGLNTKVAQVVAYNLKVPIEKVLVLPVYSFISPQHMGSGGSVTSASVCYAAIKACEQLNARITPVREELPEASWEEIVAAATAKNIDLTVRHTITATDLDVYSTFAVAMSEVTLDVLTGRFTLERVDILEDVGLSTNPNIDIGQIEGAYVQGVGYLTCEHLVYDEATGKLLTNRALLYHVPQCLDIPVKFNIHLKHDSYLKGGVYGSKAVGEMGICTANGITHSLRYAVQASRADSGASEWINITLPYTTESILTALDVKLEELLLN